MAFWVKVVDLGSHLREQYIDVEKHDWFGIQDMSPGGESVRTLVFTGGKFITDQAMIDRILRFVRRETND